MSVKPTTPEQEVAYQDIAELLAKCGAKGISGLELLAVAANMVGKMMALQDQRVVTPALAIEIVKQNIELGNRQVVESLLNASPAGRA